MTSAPDFPTSIDRWSFRRLGIILGVSAGVWAILALLCVMVGSTGNFGWPGGEVLANRIVPVLLASLIGAALAASGVAYQAVLRNPLADPYLLGVSSGASLAAYLWQFKFATSFALGQQAAAFGGAAVSVAVVFILANRRGRLEPITLLLVGVIVNAVNGSIFLLVNTLIKDPATGGGPLAFIVGGIQTNLNLSSHQVVTAATCIAIAWIAMLALSGQLNVAGVSEAEAQSLGVRIQRLRWISLILASIIAASAVAISGPIGFVGLVCPHLARLFVGNDQRRLLPLATAFGAGLLALADAASRWLANAGRVESVMPVGILTGLIGGPFFLVLLWQNRRRAAREGTP